MDENDKIYQSICRAIDEVNESLPPDKKIQKDCDSPLYASASTIDSLELTMLIVAIEQKIEEDIGCQISILAGSSLTAEDNPFETIGLLLSYISNLVEIKK